ncbi:MAG: F0F1 ATP synthase subunit gamma [Gracilibacteraceae bacterium]|nr:F0F1 ATP synthase subunit gamma [Gracilibacteraceae bacterium]
MAGVRDIRRRIRSVANMEQITKAMKMVAASKLRRAQEKVTASRPYAERLQAMLGRLAASGSELSHPLLERRPVQNIGYILVSSDKGLCGGFNTNLIRAAREELATLDGKNRLLVTIGLKGLDFFRRRGAPILAQFTGLGDSPDFAAARRIANRVTELYTSGELDEVYVIYARFISVLNQTPTVRKLLPIEPATDGGRDEYIIEPSPAAVLNLLLPGYIESRLFNALLESKASELGAKMTAMDSATENAKEMIDKLTLAMNRARQAAITTEITEIVGGAAALE